MSHHFSKLAFGAVLTLLLAGCSADGGDAVMGSYLALEYDDNLEQAVTKTCGTNSSFRGIDVSKWNGTVDWTKVKNDSNNIKFAIARVSDGLNYPDSQFQNNWKGIKEAGLVRGVYQFFRPSQDAVKQADYLLGKIGSKLDANDLPPIIDVEADEGLDAATVAAGVKKWIDRVESVLGVKPIIYTGGYFWDGHVKSSSYASYPLWHAAYPNTWSQSSSCPSISNSWSTWAMWQYSSSARIQGINNGTSDVDINVINGTEADLYKLTYGGGCAAIEPEETIIDDRDACFFGGGNSKYLRKVENAGYGNTLTWSNTWQSDHIGNYGQWNFNFKVGGKYRLDTYLTSAHGVITSIPYKIIHNGQTTIVDIDQTGHDGWKEIGTFYFAAGGDQNMVLADMVSTAAEAGKKFIMDAVRIVPVELDEIDYTKVCVAVPADGRIIDEKEKCFVGGGDAKWLRSVDGSGYENHLIWSNTESNANKEPTTTGTFELTIEQAGNYEVSVYIPDNMADISKLSGKNICPAVQYRVKHGNQTEIIEVNQASAVPGWYNLGKYEFAAGGDQFIKVTDSVSKSDAVSKTFVIDAVMLERAIEEINVKEIEQNDFQNQDDSQETTPYVKSSDFYTNPNDDVDDDNNDAIDDDSVMDDKPLSADDETPDNSPTANNNNNRQQNNVVVENSASDAAQPKKGCNSQAGDASLLISLLLAASLLVTRRQSLNKL